MADTGPLFAAIDRRNVDNQRAVGALSRAGLRLVDAVMVIAATSGLVDLRLGRDVDARSLASLGNFEIEASQPDD